MRPATRRDSSKLLVYRESDQSTHFEQFSDIGRFLPENTLLVVNQSRVFPCRLLANRPTGGKVEIFFLKVVYEGERGVPALIKSSRKKLLGDSFHAHGETFVISEVGKDGVFYLRPDTERLNLPQFLTQWGRVPIPPYIRKGESDGQDGHDYQTVYAQEVGSVAAPTAGLHFTEQLLTKLKDQGVDVAGVTLHVGMGTFRPVSTESILDHTMHSEEYMIPQSSWDLLGQAYKDGRPIIAVGTTSLRVLESAALFSAEKKVAPDRWQSTDLFLYPGREIRSVDGLITNFHLPKSSLLILVSCLLGRERVLNLYQQAIDQRFRFYSYGDGMLLLKGRSYEQ